MSKITDDSLTLIWHKMLYTSCTYMATVGVKGLSVYYLTKSDGVLLNRFPAGLRVGPDQSVTVGVVASSRRYNLDWIWRF